MVTSSPLPPSNFLIQISITMYPTSHTTIIFIAHQFFGR
jgi:hypothetical protein